MGVKNTLTAIVLGGALALGNGCDEQDRALHMQKNQATFEITHSVERDNINKRLALANDPTQIMWIYCLSDMGNIMISSPVVGKVSSSNKRIEPRETAGGGSFTYGYVGNTRYSTNEIMSADGTYGGSDNYVYWFTPEGQYFQWNGDYIVSNVPLKLERAIFNVRDIDYGELQRAQRAEKALKEGKKVNNKLELEAEEK